MGLRNVLGVLLALAASAASSTTIGVHLATWHEQRTYTGETRSVQGRAVRDEHRYCEFNPGAYVRLDSGLTFGAYSNSYCKPSAYVGWTWERPLISRVDAAFTLGAVTGYRAAPVLPVIAPSTRARLADGYGVRLTWLPRLHKSQHTSAVHLSLEKEF